MHSKILLFARKTEDEKSMEAEKQVRISELAKIVTEKETKSNLMQPEQINPHRTRKEKEKKNKRVIQIDEIFNSKYALSLANKWN